MAHFYTPGYTLISRFGREHTEYGMKLPHKKKHNAQNAHKDNCENRGKMGKREKVSHQAHSSKIPQLSLTPDCRSTSLPVIGYIYLFVWQLSPDKQRQAAKALNNASSPCIRSRAPAFYISLTHGGPGAANLLHRIKPQTWFERVISPIALCIECHTERCEKTGT